MTPPAAAACLSAQSPLLPTKYLRPNFPSSCCSSSRFPHTYYNEPIRVRLIACSSSQVWNQNHTSSILLYHMRMTPYDKTMELQWGRTRFHSTACLASLAAVVLVGAKQALALEDVNVASTGLSLTNPEVMYAIFAIEAIALVGAAVGGTLARQRKEELERLNGQLRKINEFLRSKAMMETYAPGLVYAPVGRPVDDKLLSTEREALKSLLKSGKKFLREKKPQLAYEEFKKALPLAQRIGDAIEEKKAARGLGASCQRQSKFREAIDYHRMVLEISKRTGAADGNAEAFGSIADCYCELGDLEAAQKYYNQYIDKLATDED